MSSATDDRSPSTTTGAADRSFFGHPRALRTLFMLEVWERFSYYGMRAVLVYYLYFETTRGGLGLDQSSAAALVSAYAALVYMSSVLGGWLADRLLGARRTVFAGGVVIMFGHISLAVPAGLAAVYLGLILIVLGTGLLKPNVSILVNDLYDRDDPRRESGYSIFYTGLSTGAFAGPIVVGWTQTQIGFHVAFGTAAVGMALGLVVFAVSRRNLGSAGALPTNPLPAGARAAAIGRLLLVVALCAVAGVVGVATGWLTADRLNDVITVLAIGLPIGYFVLILRSGDTSPEERRGVIAFIPLFLAVVMFALLSSQTFTVLAIYAESRVDLDVLGWSIPPAWFASVDLLVLLLLAPVFATLWTVLGRRQPSTPRKFAGGLGLAGASFLVAMLASQTTGPEGRVSALWMILLYIILACSELMISPVGAVATARLAPTAFYSQMMALWFLSGAAGNGIGIQVVEFYSAETEVAYFGVLGAVSIGLGVLLFAAAPALRRFASGLDYSPEPVRAAVPPS